MEQILEKLFESVPKVRILRLFMRNPQGRFRFEEIATKSQVKKPTVQLELKKFMKLGLVQESMMQIELPYQYDRKSLVEKVTVYGTNPQFPLLHELHGLIAKASVAPRNQLFRQIRGLGKVKLAVISGVFIDSENSRTDLLVVGDDIQKGKLHRFLVDTESELGKPIQHTVMDTKEFLYRMDMYDRFLRDILEYPHEKLVNKFNI